MRIMVRLLDNIEFPRIEEEGWGHSSEFSFFRQLSKFAYIHFVILTVCILLYNYSALAGDNVCGSWNDIRNSIEYNFGVLSSVNSRLPDSQKSYTLSNPIGVEFVNVPDPVRDDIKNIINMATYDNNFRVSYDKIEKTTIIFIYYDNDNLLSNNEIDDIFKIVRMNFNLNSVEMSDKKIGAWIEDSIKKSNDISQSSIRVSARSPVTSGTVSISDDAGHLFVRLSFISPMNGDKRKIKTDAGMSDLSKSIFGFLGVSGQINFQDSIYSSTSISTIPSNVDIAMARILSISNGLADWRRGYSVASKVCSSGGHF